MKNSSFIMIYIPHPSKDSAIETAQKLLEQKLIACANIFDSVTSLYRWNNSLMQETEVILIGKTKSELFPKIQKYVEEIHPYDLPCILSYPIHKGNEKYLNWVDEETTN